MQIPLIKSRQTLVKTSTPNPHEDLFEKQRQLKLELDEITNDLKQIVYEAELISENAWPSQVVKSDKIARLLEINLAIEGQVNTIMEQLEQEMISLKPRDRGTEVALQTVNQAIVQLHRKYSHQMNQIRELEKQLRDLQKDESTQYKDEYLNSRRVTTQLEYRAEKLRQHNQAQLTTRNQSEEDRTIESLQAQLAEQKAEYRSLCQLRDTEVQKVARTQFAALISAQQQQNQLKLAKRPSRPKKPTEEYEPSTKLFVLR